MVKYLFFAFYVSRFLGDNRKLIQPFTYLPFGEGPRQCVGMKFALFKVKFCLFHVLSKISFQVCSETDVSYHFATVFSVSNRLSEGISFLSLFSDPTDAPARDSGDDSRDCHIESDQKKTGCRPLCTSIGVKIYRVFREER